MGKETGISWCSHTHNPWHGCSEVSPGCDNCYARVLNARWGGSNWGKGAPRKVMSDHYWRQPLLWNAEAEAAGVQRRVFCASMADCMDDHAPVGER
jgi:protein gp37